MEMRPRQFFLHRQKVHGLIQENQSADQNISLPFATSPVINLNVVALIFQELASAQMLKGSVLIFSTWYE